MVNRIAHGRDGHQSVEWSTNCMTQSDCQMMHSCRAVLASNSARTCSILSDSIFSFSRILLYKMDVRITLPPLPSQPPSYPKPLRFSRGLLLKLSFSRPPCSAATFHRSPLQQPTTTTTSSSPYTTHINMSFFPTQSKPQKPTESEESIRSLSASNGTVLF